MSFFSVGKEIIMKEVVIIGAGIVGSFLAYDLCHYKDVHVTLIDKHNDVAEETSKANSAIIHAGYDPKEGTLKARLNKRGADLYYKLYKELGFEYHRCGAFVVACNEEEEAVLDHLYQQGVKRHVEMKYLSGDEVRKQEPHCSDGIIKALSVPETAIVTPWQVCEYLVEEAIINGLDLRLNEEVKQIQHQHLYKVVTNKQSYKADLVINSAGLGSAHIMQMIEEKPLFTITPKRGQYFVLSKQANHMVDHIIYPVPSSVGKGVLALPTIHGNILLGPTGEIMDDVDTGTTSAGLAQVKEKITKTIKDIPYQEVIHTYSGVRPIGNDGDFYIEESKAHPGFIHLGCIDSPGLASAPAISEYVIEHFLCNHISTEQKDVYHHRKQLVEMRLLTPEQKQAMIQKQPKYGHIVCFCEQISEQEVIDCIHHPCGATSIQGVKKRVRPGMGKCQGGYCEVEIAKLLARELQIPLHEVKYNETSYFMDAKEDVK